MILIKLGTGPAPACLTLNRDKYMIVLCRKSVSTPSSPLLLESHSLEWVDLDMFKYLGFLLSHDLSWGEHDESICSRLGRSLAFCTEDSTIMLWLLLYFNSIEQN